MGTRTVDTGMAGMGIPPIERVCEVWFRILGLIRRAVTTRWHGLRPRLLFLCVWRHASSLTSLSASRRMIVIAIDS